MASIRLIKRAKYAGDVHAELLKLGWNLDAATLFVENIPDVDVVPEWTKPEDGLPEDGVDVLCWYEYFRYGSYNRNVPYLRNWVSVQWKLGGRILFRTQGASSGVDATA